MPSRAFDPLDLSSREFWTLPARERGTTFAELRAQRPVSWHAPVEGGYGAMDAAGGFDRGVASAPFWAIVRHADIAAISRDTESFSSASGVMIEEMPKDYLEASSSFLVMDPPRHSRYRKIVSGAFTPRSIAALEEEIGRKVDEVVDATVALGECEIVEALSNRIPLWTISQLMGVPENRRTVVRDVQIAGQQVAAGENVVLFYESANRDESLFPDPWRFDITREPKHAAFGGGGPHFCMGAHLARRQVGAVFSRLARHVERFEASEPELFGSHFVHGIKRMNCRFAPITRG